MDTLNELLISIGDAVMLQDGFSQPAQHASVDGAKPEPVNEQRRCLPDDFVLEDELVWLDGMGSKIRFQLEEWIEPVAVAGKDRRPFIQDGEGGGLHCR